MAKNLVCSRCGEREHTSKNCNASVEGMHQWKKENF